MKVVAGLIFIFALCVSGFGQDSIRTVNAPEVIISAERKARVESLDRLDSLLWQRSQLLDLGRLMSSSGQANAMLYGPTGTAAMLRTRGLAPDHTGLLWNGVPLHSPTLGMADFSLVPAFFFDGLTVQNTDRAGSATSPGIAGDVGVIEEKVSRSGESLGGHLERNSLSNTTAAIQYRKSSGRWVSDTRLIRQWIENKFTYTDRFELDRPLKEQRHNDGLSSGFAQRFTYHRGNHLLQAKGWGSVRDMELPSQMGISKATLSDQSDRQLRVMISDNWTSPSGKDELITQVTWLSDVQTFHEWKEGSAIVDARTDGKQAFIHSAYSRTLTSRWKTGLTGQLHRMNIVYDKVRSYEVWAPSAVWRTSRETERTKSNVYVRAEDRTGRPLSIQWLAAQSVVIRRIHNDFRLGAEIGEKVRQPDFNELYWQNAGDESLLAERSSGGRLFVDGRMADGVLRWQVEGFYQDVKNWIQWIPDAKGNWRPVNYKRVRTSGVEGSLRFVWNCLNLKWVATQRYQWNQARGVNSSQWSDTESFAMVYTPAHRAFTGIDVMSKKWNAGISGRFQSRRYTDESNHMGRSLDPFYVLDAFASYTFSLTDWCFTLGMRVDNVIDHQYELVRGYAIPGRVVQLNLSFQFKK